MKLTAVWIARKSDRENNKTKECIQKECAAFSGTIQLLVYGAPKKLKNTGADFGEKTEVEWVEGFGGKDTADVLADVVQRAEGKYITAFGSGDTFTEKAWKTACSRAEKFGSPAVVMLKKMMPDGLPGAFSADENFLQTEMIDLRRNYTIYPFYAAGTLIRTDCLEQIPIHPESGMETERRLMLDLCLAENQVLYVPEKSYYSGIEREGDIFLFRGIFRPEFYDRAFLDFWIPYFGELREKYGRIPMFVQCHAMFSISRRIQANLNNRNKHVIPEGREEDILRLIGTVLQELDVRAVNNAYGISECKVSSDIKWVYGILRNGEEYRFAKSYNNGKYMYTAGSCVLGQIPSLRTNIQFMNYEDGRLEIDGTVHSVLFAMADRVFFEFKHHVYRLGYNDRYALTKVFGVSISKNHSFHVTIPLGYCHNAMLGCYAEIGGEIIQIQFTYQSHFSRMSDRFMNSYWWFGPEDEPYLMTRSGESLKICSVKPEEHKKQEKKLIREMRQVGLHEDRRALLFIAIRKAFFFYKKRKKKPIWMYLDKIYKGGDSSEYLFRYASAQKDNIQHYYLIDRNATDYERLKKDGFKPLVRGSIRHRLVFLAADMMVISNSTVYAFNNFGMINSSYIRDLPDFHVCCVQHGMSIQKIAVAQNRLRDNTRLYFCASKYELMNLQRPVYDYVGYGALKLTGVPRYDGLINDDKKQILISPTWRMQAAAPVRTSEGEQRDYNPLFKKSPYFRVYNSLINDERLIEAAKKYGYRIKYVLHPIVSAQLKDFDKNDYVDIIPAVGDMSYETMFRESSLMVTDFSGVQFDFAYMRKPVVYLHHRDIPEHYEEGTFFYESMGFGEICHDNDELIDLLTAYMADGCHMKEEYVRRADDFFHYSDHNNCERIYREMIAYQKEHVLGQKKHEILQGEFDLKDHHHAVIEADRILEKHNTMPQPNTTTDNYYNQRVREGTILLLGLGKNVNGNLTYILNELNRDPYFTGYRIYVRTKDTSDLSVQEAIRRHNWTRTITVPNNAKYAELLETAQYLITEVYFPENWIKREGQTVINIWHGTPLKKLGLSKNSENIHQMGVEQRNFIDSDYLIYPNEYTRDNMLASYKVKELLTGKVGLIGYARTGGILSTYEDGTEELREKLAPGCSKIYAYMPTWRDYMPEEQLVKQTVEFLDQIDACLKEDEVLYVNLHHKVNGVVDYSRYRHIRKFPAYMDTYRLLAATDALITDYSSVFFDYLVLRRQIVLLCPDYEEYNNKRGTYMNLMDLPFDKVRNAREAADALHRGKTYDDSEVFRQFCGYDSTANARRLCAILKGDFAPEEDRTELREIPDDGKRKILIDNERFEPSFLSTTLKEFIMSRDPEASDIWISIAKGPMSDNTANAYPALYHIPVIGTQARKQLTGRGNALRKLYLKGAIEFKDSISYLKYDYALDVYRKFGHARYDAVILYDDLDAQRIIELSEINAERYFIISADIIRNLDEGADRVKRELADAVRYAASRSRAVYAENEDVLGEVRSRFPEIGEVRLFAGLETLRQLTAAEESPARQEVG